MTWGGRYEFKADQNPPPGLYESDLAKTRILPRSKSAHINVKLIEERPKDTGPSPGQYDAHLKPFGELPQNMTWGGKYVF